MLKHYFLKVTNSQITKYPRNHLLIFLSSKLTENDIKITSYNTKLDIFINDRIKLKSKMSNKSGGCDVFVFYVTEKCKNS